MAIDESITLTLMAASITAVVAALERTHAVLHGAALKGPVDGTNASRRQMSTTDLPPLTTALNRRRLLLGPHTGEPSAEVPQIPLLAPTAHMSVAPASPERPRGGMARSSLTSTLRRWPMPSSGARPRASASLG